MEVEIRKAKIEEVDAIIDLNQKLFEYEFKFDKTLNCLWPKKNKDYFKKSINSKNSLSLIAINNNKIIGYFNGSILVPKLKENYRSIKKIAEMDDSYILPPYRRLGIGSKFVKRFFEWARKKEVKRNRAVVSTKNQGSINFHKKNKFKEYEIIFEKNI